MKPILYKIVDDSNNIIGVVVNEEGQENPLSLKGMYHPLYIKLLTEAGVQYYDYDPLHCKTPDDNGNLVSIDGLPTYQEKIPASMWSLIKRAEVDILTPAEASNFYTVSADNVLSFPEGNYTITTREQLLEYCRSIQQSVIALGYCTDHRPLNYFVSPSCLPNPLVNNHDEDDIFIWEVIQRRRVFRDYDDFIDLVRWLEAKVPDFKYTPDDQISFLRAYNYWGVEGIKDSCIGSFVQVDVHDTITSYQPTQGSNPFIGRDKHSAIIDKTLKVYYLDKNMSWDSMDEIGNQMFIPKSEGELFELKRLQFKKFFKGCEIYSLMSNNYIDYKFMAEAGFTYVYRVALDGSITFYNSTAKHVAGGFSLYLPCGNLRVPLSKVKSVDSYHDWAKAAMFALYASSTAILKPVYETSYEVYKAARIDCISAIKSFGHMAIDKNYIANQDIIANMLAPKGNFMNILTDYLDDIPEDFYGIFDVPETLTSKEQFLDAVTYEKIQELMTTAAGSKDTTTQLALTWYDNIKAVVGFISEGLSICNLGSGFMLDGTNEFSRLVDLFYTLLLIDPSLRQNGLAYLQDSSMCNIDLDTVVPKRAQAFKGCLDDLATLWDKRCAHVGVWCFATKAFAEISNKPLRDRRHYAVELLAMWDKNVRDYVVNFVTSSINAQEFSESTKTYLRAQAGKYAADLFYKIVLNRATLMNDMTPFTQTFGSNKSEFEVEVPLSVIQVCLNARVDLLYCSLFDYVKYEYNAAFNFYCVNADITPWRVKPIYGQIPLYNFSVNYYGKVIQSLFPDDVAQALPQALIDSERTLKDKAIKQYFIEVDDEAFICKPEDYKGSLSAMLDRTFFESFHWYQARWKEESMLAQEQDKTIVSIPLMSDIVYGNVAYLYGEEPITETVYDENPGFRKDPTWLFDIKPIILSPDDGNNVLVAKAYIKPFSFYGLSPYEAQAAQELLVSDYKFKDKLVYLNNLQVSIVSSDGKVVSRQLNSNTMGALINAGIAKELSSGTYILRANNGIFIYKEGNND